VVPRSRREGSAVASAPPELLGEIREENAARAVALLNAIRAQGREKSRLLRELGC
jgi:hypothetical protein